MTVVKTHSARMPLVVLTVNVSLDSLAMEQIAPRVNALRNFVPLMSVAFRRTLMITSAKKGSTVTSPVHASI